MGLTGSQTGFHWKFDWKLLLDVSVSHSESVEANREGPSPGVTWNSLLNLLRRHSDTVRSIMLQPTVEDRVDCGTEKFENNWSR